MQFRVLSQGVVIGATNLESLDPSMGVATGVFAPSENYGAVQPIFRLYATAGITVAGQDETKLKAYYAARDALNLSLVTPAGETVPTESIHITDFSEETGEYEVTVFTAGTEAFEKHLAAGSRGPQ